jgi:hypothetical protein
MGDAESQLCSPESPECDALIWIIQILSQRTAYPLLLADLGALLPEHHKQVIRCNGRLRKWILQYPIFALTGPRGAEHITLNLDDNDEEDQVFVKALSCRQNTISAEEVVMAEDLLDNLLEHVLDLIDQVSNLRKKVDAQDCLSRHN